MNWIYLLFAIGFEVTGTLLLKKTEGFTVLWPTVAMSVSYGMSLFLLALAIRTIDVGTAYAIWAGVGTALVVLAGIWLYQEPVTFLRMIFILFIIIGAVGLRLTAQGT